MGHNVWTHIEAVQRANRVYDSGQGPDMLMHPFDPVYNFRSVVEKVFAARDRQKSLQIIDDHANIWQRVIGTRGFTGKKTVNAHSMFNSLFDIEEPEEVNDDDLDPDKLSALEDSIHA